MKKVTSFALVFLMLGIVVFAVNAQSGSGVITVENAKNVTLLQNLSQGEDLLIDLVALSPDGTLVAIIAQDADYNDILSVINLASNEVVFSVDMSVEGSIDDLIFNEDVTQLLYTRTRLSEEYDEETSTYVQTYELADGVVDLVTGEITETSSDISARYIERAYYVTNDTFVQMGAVPNADGDEPIDHMKIINPTSDEVYLEFDLDTDEIDDLFDISSDLSYLLATTDEGLYLVDSADLTLDILLLETDEHVDAARFSPNGQWIAFTEYNYNEDSDKITNSIHIYSVASGEITTSITRSKDEGYPAFVEFNPDATLLFGTLGAKVLIIDVITGEILNEFAVNDDDDDDGIDRFTVSADGRFIVVRQSSDMYLLGVPSD